MLSGHQRITWRRNIAKNFNRLSRVHERYRRQTDRRQTDGQRQIANMNMSSRSLKSSRSKYVQIRTCKANVTNTSEYLLTNTSHYYTGSQYTNGPGI